MKTTQNCPLSGADGTPFCYGIISELKAVNAEDAEFERLSGRPDAALGGRKASAQRKGEIFAPLMTSFDVPSLRS